MPSAILNARIYERPSGSQLLATVADLAVMALTLALRVASSDPHTNTDIATVLLTLPVTIVTMALLFSPIARRALSLSVSGVLFAILASIMAVIDAVVFAIDIATRPENGVHFKLFWRSFATFAVLVGATSLAVLLIRTFRYVRDAKGG